MAKRRVTTHSKVASALCAHVYVFACTPRRAHPGALPMSGPTWAARGVFSASCFVSERALPRAAEVLPEAVGAHPRFCVSAAEERAGAFREESGGRKRGGVAVSLGMSRPCGWLSTRSSRLVQTHRRGRSHDYSCTHTIASALQVKSPLLKGNFRNQVWVEVMCTCVVV